MLRKSPALLITAVLALSVFAQKQYKPYTEWTDKDAQKILNDSPWGHTQIETDTSEMFFKPDGAATAPTTSDRTERGATNQATSVNYHVRFLSARPIREALARVIESAQKTPNEQLSNQLKNFVARNFGNYIVVSVAFDTKDPRFANAPKEAFVGAVPGILKVNTYLDRNDGKRLFLSDYQAPTNDGLGAKFVFPRTDAEGKPFLTPDFSQVRFYSEVSKSVKLDVRFKVSDMIYNGALEY
ncbi:MAG: hypothetical protein ACJ741_13635 [Pyrinomonadaceae bacterium]